MEANLGRGHRDTELNGDLFVRQPVDVFQHDEHAELGGQLVEADRKPVEQRGRLRRIFGLRAGAQFDGILDHRVERLGAMTTAALHDRVRGVGGDAVHPRAELRVTAKLRQALPGT
jgi:hypothetical protein